MFVKVFRSIKKANTLLTFSLALFLSLNSFAQETTSSGPMHGFAMHGAPKYGADFHHFLYANPDAPKKGKLRLAVVGDSYDSFNPFLVKGVSAQGVGTYLHDTLMKKADDEAFTLYGLIAETIEVANDRSWVEFKLNPNAKFHDGQPITSQDVKFTFETLTQNESVTPFYRAYYSDVDNLEVKNDQTIRFNFKTNTNKELPLILAELPVLPKHYYAKGDFNKADLTIPVGSGPYTIKSFDAGRNITWSLKEDYWAKDLPVNRGFYNFKEITFEYYKDNTVALEAFKAGEFDFRQENTARNWANAYVGPKFDSGELVKEEVKHSMPAGMQGFAMNTRRDLFADRKVREALAYAFDFEWTNTNLFYDQYTRTKSYFENSELAATGHPSQKELEILTPFKDKLPAEVFSKPYSVPENKDPGSTRSNLKKALGLFKEAGWSVKNKVLTHEKSGKQMAFEVLIYSKDWERILHPFIKNLNKLGVKAEIRLVDTTQYVNRLKSQDFDMFVAVIGQSNSPGNEQRAFWHSSTANQPGSRNYMGIQDPVVDALIDLVISAPDRESLVNRTRALDRVLLWGHYVIPNWHNPSHRIAYSKELQKPKVAPKSGIDLDTWWFK